MEAIPRQLANLLVVAVVGGAIWGIRANWASFPEWAQTALKVIGWVLGGIMVALSGKHPGF